MKRFYQFVFISGFIGATFACYNLMAQSISGGVNISGAVKLTKLSSLPPNILLDGGFEAGTFVGKWTQVNCGTAGAPEVSCTSPYTGQNLAFINSNISFVRSGTYSLGLFFNGDTAGNDLNLWAAFQPGSWDGFPTGVSPIYVRGYWYLKTPEAGDSCDGGSCQQKLIYLTDIPPVSNWNVVLDSFNNEIVLTYHDFTVGSQVAHYITGSNISYDTWCELEIGVVPNTPNVADGSITVWMNGSQVYQTTGINLRGSNTDGISWIMLGQQVQPSTGTAVRYRYLDDLYVATSYIP